MSQEREFGKLLKQRRMELGWTQAELAKRSGYALISIKKFEQGTRHPSRDNACHIARVLELQEGSAPYEALVQAARLCRAEDSAGASDRQAPPGPPTPPPNVPGDQPVEAAPNNPQLTTLTPRQRKHNPRYALIDKVRRHWIDGVLMPSFAAIAPIRMNLTNRPDLVLAGADVARSLAFLDHSPPATTEALRPVIQERVAEVDGQIRTIFETAYGELLIVGALGAGKTTALLLLAENLLALAERDPTQPDPGCAQPGLVGRAASPAGRVAGGRTI